MDRFFTLLAENILVVIGFAIYGLLVYYMVARTIRRYTGKKNHPNSGKWSGHSKSISDQDSTESSTFFTMFNKSAEAEEDEDPHRKDFSKDITTANSYVHQKSREE